MALATYSRTGLQRRIEVARSELAQAKAKGAHARARLSTARHAPKAGLEAHARIKGASAMDARGIVGSCAM